MSTSDFLIVRIIPTQPVGPTAFRAALQGMTIIAWDKWVRDAQNDRELGRATGLATRPQNGVPLSDIPLLGLSGTPPVLQQTIMQHFGVLPNNQYQMYSVATAVIVVNRAALDGPDKEYPTPTSYDVRLELGASAGPIAVVSRQKIVDFNIKPVTATLSKSQPFYMKIATDVYLPVDVPVSPLPAGTNVVTPSRDGTPPSFSALKDAINSVLAKDSPDGASSLETMTTYLSTAQAQQIAAELINNRLLDPAPVAPYPTTDLVNGNPGTIFEDMYTIPDTGGQVEQSIDEARTKFEGERSSYYALHTSDSLQLANFVFSVIAAIYAEFYTSQAPRAALEVPIKSNINHVSAISTPTISLSGPNGGPLDPPFTVPAAFFYALTTTYAISQDPDTRLNLLLTTPASTLTSTLSLAISAGVLGPAPITCTSTLQTSASTTLTPAQAIRRLSALQASARPAQSQQVVDLGAADAGVRGLVSAWLGFAGADADVAEQVWFPAAQARAYLAAVLEVVAPGDEALIGEVLVDLRMPPGAGGTGLGGVVQDVDDLMLVTETQWLEFFTRHGELLPRQYLLGDLASRVHSFVQDVTKVLFVLPPPQGVPGPASQPAIPSLGGASDGDVLVLFFSSYGSFSLSDTLDEAKLEDIKAAALQLFGGDEGVAAFVASAVYELWVLYQLTDLKGRC